jgi:hypothetical protein
MKRSTIYLEDDVYKALKFKAFEVNESLSGLVNEALRGALRDDHADLVAIEARKSERPVSYAHFLRDLKKRGQI